MSQRVLLRNLKVSAIFLGMLALLFSSCKKEDPGNPGPNEVWLEYQLFRPAQIEVTAGTIVKFINKGNPNHQVQGTLFSTGTLQTDDVYEYTFSTPGVYYFSCGIHGNIQAEQVAVRVN